MITTAEDGTTADREAGPKITEIITILLTSARTPTIPGTGLPDTANQPTLLTADTRDQPAPTLIAAKARVVKNEALLDSGLLAGDFINAETLRILGGSHHLRSANETVDKYCMQWTRQ